MTKKHFSLSITQEEQKNVADNHTNWHLIWNNRIVHECMPFAFFKLSRTSNVTIFPLRISLYFNSTRRNRIVVYEMRTRQYLSFMLISPLLFLSTSFQLCYDDFLMVFSLTCIWMNNVYLPLSWNREWDEEVYVLCFMLHVNSLTYIFDSHSSHSAL